MSRKFKKNDVVVLNNPKKTWVKSHKKVHGEIGLVKKYLCSHGGKIYTVVHNHPDGYAHGWSVHECDMEKIGVL